MGVMNLKRSSIPAKDVWPDPPYVTPSGTYPGRIQSIAINGTTFDFAIVVQDPNAPTPLECPIVHLEIDKEAVEKDANGDVIDADSGKRQIAYMIGRPAMNAAGQKVWLEQTMSDDDGEIGKPVFTWNGKVGSEGIFGRSECEVSLLTRGIGDNGLPRRKDRIKRRDGKGLTDPGYWPVEYVVLDVSPIGESQAAVDALTDDWTLPAQTEVPGVSQTQDPQQTTVVLDDPGERPRTPRKGEKQVK